MTPRQILEDEIKRMAFTVGLDCESFIDKVDFDGLIELHASIKIMEAAKKLKQRRRENERKAKGFKS